MRRKSSLLFVLLLCLAQVPLLGLNLGSKPASAQAEQDLLWNHDTGNRVLSVSISSDGNYIAAGGYGKVYLFSNTDNTPLWSYDTVNNVRSVSISSDGNYIAARNSYGKIYLFSRTNNTPLWSYDTGCIGFSTPVSISSDGNYIAAGGYGKVYLFSNTDNIPLRSYQTGGVESISISSDGNYIAAGDTYGIHLFSRGAESISGAILWTVIAVIVIGCSVMIYKLRQHQRLSVKRRGKRGA